MKSYLKNTSESNRGAVLMTLVLLFTGISLVIVLGLGLPIINGNKAVTAALQSRVSFAASEGGLEDYMYRLTNAMNFDNTEVVDVDGTQVISKLVIGAEPNTLDVVAEGNRSNAIRTTKGVVAAGSGASFNYGVQVGNGGFRMENNSSVLGNVYANGSVIGFNSNFVDGDVVSAGPTGLIDGITASSSAYANTIQNSTVYKDAYYQTILNTTVGGTEYPGSEDQPVAELPISDAQIDAWKDDAVAGGVINSPCPYIIESDTVIGPVKINCDLILKGNDYNVDLLGPIWVEGDIEMQNGPTVRVHDSIGNRSIAFIADEPSDSDNGGMILLKNSTSFGGNGNSSYVLMVSQNTSAENGGTNVAINVANSVAGDLLVYARHGEILLQNSVNLKEVSAHLIRLTNFAEVVYESGLISLLFTSGPGGGYIIDGWKEVE